MAVSDQLYLKSAWSVFGFYQDYQTEI